MSIFIWNWICETYYTLSRVYRRNGGDLLELVRCQWQEAAAAVGAETEKIYLSSQIIASEKNRWGDIGKYYEAMRCTFAAPESRKQATILYHEWFWSDTMTVGKVWHFWTYSLLTLSAVRIPVTKGSSNDTMFMGVTTPSDKCFCGEIIISHGVTPIFIFLF